jgi:hypothetical protein
MRTFLIITLGAWMLPLQPADSFEFIRQSRLYNGVVVTTDFPLGSLAGEILSAPLEAELTVFQLYSSQKDANGLTQISKLDEKSVGTFLPEVSIEMKSEDPYMPTTTRADRPYQVAVSIKGLAVDSSFPDYAKTVSLKRGYKLYSPLSYSPNGTKGDYADSHVFRSNGTFTEPSVYQQIPDGTPTQAIGAENFSAYLLPEANQNYAQLASAEVIIWPVGSAGIVGIEDGAKYNGIPSKGSITLLNAYPRSTTYAQVYKGRPMLGTQGRTIPGTVRTYGAAPDSPNLPQSASVPIPLKSLPFDEDGPYTIEVLTVTPFSGGAPERLTYVCFLLDRTIEVRGNVVTIE